MSPLKKTNMMKYVVFALLTFIIVQESYAQNYSRGFRRINNNDLSGAYDHFSDIKADDQNDVVALYALAIIFSHAQYPNQDLFKAYSLIMEADAKKNNLSDRQLRRSSPDFSPDLIDIQKERINNTLYHYVKSSNNIETINKFLKECQESPYVGSIIKIKHSLEFEKAKQLNSVSAFEHFISNYPDAEQIERAGMILEELIFQQAKMDDTPQDYISFISRYPDSEYIDEATSLLHNAAFLKASNLNTIESYSAFIERHPAAKQVDQAKSIKNELLLWDKAITAKQLEFFEDYIAHYPEGQFINDAKQLRINVLMEEVKANPTLSNINVIFSKVSPDELPADDLAFLLSIKEEALKRDIRLNLRNNQTYNSFLFKPNGLMHLAYNDRLYSLCDDRGDCWSRLYGDISTTAVAFCPEVDQVAYRISNNSVIHKTVDKGENWMRIHNGLPGRLNLHSVYVNPHNPNDVFLIDRHLGLFKTSDAGFFWENVFSGSGQQMTFCLQDRNKLFLLANGSVYKSVDGGTNWQSLENNLKAVSAGSHVYGLFAFNDNEKTSILAFLNTGIYRSDDLGEKWTPFSNGIGNGVFVSAVYFQDNKITIATFERGDSNDYKNISLFQTDTANTGWAKIPTNLSAYDIITGITKHLNHDGLLVASKTKIGYIDNDYNVIGLNYGVMPHSKIYAFKHIYHDNESIQYALVENNNYIDIYKRGLWRSVNNGITWKKCITYDHHSNWASSKLQNIFISPHDLNEIWLFDNDIKYVSSDGGSTWSTLIEKFNNNAFRYQFKVWDFKFHPELENIVYFVEGVNNYYLFRFDLNTNGLTKLFETQQSFIIAEDNTDHFLSRNLHLSTDGGWTWNNITNNLKEIMDQRYYVGDIVVPVSLTSDRIIIVARDYWNKSSFRFVASNEQGKSWINISDIHRAVTNIYVNSCNPAYLLMAQKSGPARYYSEYQELIIYKSNDYGNSWEPIYTITRRNVRNHTDKEFFSDGLLSSLISMMNISWVNGKQYIYLGFDRGLIVSEDNGSTWSTIGGIK